MSSAPPAAAPRNATRPPTHPIARLTALSRRVRGDSVLRNALSLIAVNVTASGFGFLIWAVAARLYATTDVGAGSAYTSVIPLITTLAGLGMSEVIVRHYHRHARQRHLVLRAGLYSGALTSVVTALWFTLGRDREPLNLLGASWWQALSLGVGVVGSAMSLLTTAIVVASRRSHLLLAQILAGGVQRLLLVALLADLGAAGLTLAFALGSVTEALVGATIVFTHIQPARTQDTDQHTVARGFVLSNWIAMAVSLAPRALVVTIVANQSGPETAAYVGIPMLALTLINMFTATTSRAVFAESSAHPAQLGQLMRRGAKRALLGTTVLAGTVAAGATLMLGLFGEDYARESSTLLRLLALSAIVSIPNYFLDVGLNVRGAHGAFFMTNLLGTGALLGALMVTSSHGAAGVGVGWIIGQVCYSIVGSLFWLSVRQRPEPWTTAPAPRDDRQTAVAGTH